MSCPFVAPELIRVALSTGDYLDVKRELTAGEYRHFQTAMLQGGLRPGEPATLDPELVGLTRVLEYLVAWSFIDFDGRPVPVSIAALRQMHKRMFDEILEAVDVHEREQDRLREDRLKNPSGAAGLKAVS